MNGHCGLLVLAVCLIRLIVHYKAPTNKHLVIHHTVYYGAMVIEALAQLRAAAKAIDTEVCVLFDEEAFVLEPECAAKLEVGFSTSAFIASALCARPVVGGFGESGPLKLTSFSGGGDGAVYMRRFCTSAH